MKLIDPAQAADQYTIPDNGKRFVGAVFTIKALSDSPMDVDADRAAAVIGSNGQTYSPDIAGITGYMDFGNGTIHETQGETVTGSVAFQVSAGVNVTKVQWTPDNPRSVVQWKVGR